MALVQGAGERRVGGRNRQLWKMLRKLISRVRDEPQELRESEIQGGISLSGQDATLRNSSVIASAA